MVTLAFTVVELSPNPGAVFFFFFLYYVGTGQGKFVGLHWLIMYSVRWIMRAGGR